jgi:sec-independent protein translocase protein TatC
LSLRPPARKIPPSAPTLPFANLPGTFAAWLGQTPPLAESAMPRPTSYEYPDDIFADTRMSFGDHIEELRSRLFKAIKALGFFLMIGFVLDGVGYQFGWHNFGVGRPMMKVIVDPVETQARNFYYRRSQAAIARLPDKVEWASADEAAAIRKRMQDGGLSLTDISAAERQVLNSAPRPLPVRLDVSQLAPVFGPPKDPAAKTIELTLQVLPAHVAAFNGEGETLLENRKYLTTLSAQEAFMVYFKVSLLCGAVLASPWIFYQIWAFVAAGMYPHERNYVYRYLPFSLGLFLSGVLLCQFVVLPGAVKALLGFNEFVELDPDLRLNEWLTFAIILPLVFGVSFQTPLVMVFFNRIGTFGWEDYLSKWRYAVMVLAVFAAIITPTPDAVTMLYLFVPMFSLYMLGVGVCWFFPPEHEREEAEEPEVAV